MCPGAELDNKSASAFCWISLVFQVATLSDRWILRPASNNTTVSPNIADRALALSYFYN